MKVDPSVDEGVFFRDVVHLFGWTCTGTTRGEELSAFSCNGIELKCTVGVQEVAAVLPDELRGDAFWFSSWDLQRNGELAR